MSTSKRLPNDKPTILRGSNGYAGANIQSETLDKQVSPTSHQKLGPLQTIFNLPDEGDVFGSWKPTYFQDEMQKISAGIAVNHPFSLYVLSVIYNVSGYDALKEISVHIMGKLGHEKKLSVACRNKFIKSLSTFPVCLSALFHGLFFMCPEALLSPGHAI